MKIIKVTYDNCRLLIGQELIKKEDVIKLIDECRRGNVLLADILKKRIEE